ncbi:hypothetical protein NQ318_002904 [Aromia moschata]|uniref:C2H2-type domain-containing protein n=1 Tax=Aromia moschata TaxID=1265417 RepID=A0AAV8X788_9CUCU|nr:hypothetical protein NQ318_002904 [Aromia moschata]
MQITVFHKVISVRYLLKILKRNGLWINLATRRQTIHLSSVTLIRMSDGIKKEYAKSNKFLEDVAITHHCERCPYMTKRKGDLSKHVLIHQKSLKIRTYDCSVCSYKAKYKKQLNQTHVNS